jgi:hypothetical protein
MTDKWFLQEIEKLLAHRNRVVIVDPSGQCEFLVSLLDRNTVNVLETDSGLTENWQQVKEELFLRHKAEKEFADRSVVFYTRRPQDKLSFLFDYCFTHGCLDLTNPAQWLKKKLFDNTGLQIKFDSPMLLTAAKLGVGKDLAWWKKVLQNLEELVNLNDELLPFLNDPEAYSGALDPDVRQLFEAKLFELLGQPYMAKPAKTLAEEVAKRIFDGLVYNDIPEELLKTYYRWNDSSTYRPSLEKYANAYKVESITNPWQAHPDHCFAALDKLALRQLTSNLNDKTFVSEKLAKIKARTESGKAASFVPTWWGDVVTLLDFDGKQLSSCNSFNSVVDYYINHFAPLDRAIRNLYMHFLEEVSVVRPLQERYESYNHELLQTWFEFAKDYKSDQQGYLVDLFKSAKAKTAVIVGDGISYEIADYVAKGLQSQFTVDREVMLADMPSETEHNMSAMYVGDNEVLATKKERETRLSAITGKDIKYLELEDLHYGESANFLVLSYKDIDDVAEKVQHGALKLFAEFEKVLKDKIALLLNIGYQEVHLVTDHGFVLTGLLDESDKIEVKPIGNVSIKERYFRAADKQVDSGYLEFPAPYGEYKYVYAAKSHRPFKSRGVYGFAHGGFAPQEIITPKFTFRRTSTGKSGLDVLIANKAELAEVTGEQFAVKLQAADIATDLFSTKRIVEVLLYAGGAAYQCSSRIEMEPAKSETLSFSFGLNQQVEAVLIDADTKEQLDKAMVKKTNLRDLGGLM